MVNTIHSSYRVTLKPLTGIHVWSGVEALVGNDLIYKGDTACLVDYDALDREVLEAIAREPEKLSQILSSYSTRLRCKITATIKARPKPNTLVKLTYTSIPGSTLKGYIRTAILYHLARKLPPQQLVSRLQSGVNFYDLKNASQGFEASFLRAPRIKAQGGFVDLLQMLLVSDPLAVSDVGFTLSEARVYELPPRLVASIYLILLARGVMEYRVTVLKPLTMDRVHQRVLGLDECIRVLQQATSIDIVGSLREFGCSVLEYEIDRVRRIINANYKFDGYTLDDYLKLLEDFKLKYCSSQYSNCVIARIGLLTGHQAKTLLPLVKQVDPSFYKKIVGWLSSHYGRLWDEKTVKLYIDDGRLLGLGWCELCFHAG